MRWLAPLLALATLDACNCGGVPCGLTGGGGAGGFGGGSGTDNALVVLAGGPVSIDLTTSPRTNTCDNSQVLPSRVDLEVLDPQNLRVADASASTPVMAGDGFVHTTVSFTPAVAGPYHITARFEPDLGIVQRDVVAALDKRSDATVLTLANPCDAVGFDGPTLFCLQSTALTTVRNGATVSAVTAVAFDFSGDKLWTTTPGQVQVRSVGSDGTLQPYATFDLSDGDAPRLLAKGDHALLLGVAHTQQLRLWPDGGITSSQPLQLSLSNPHAQWVPDVGFTVTGTPDDSPCSFALVGDAFDGGCDTSAQVIDLGADDDGVYWYDPTQVGFNSYTVHVSGWRAGEARAAGGSLGFVSPTMPEAGQPPSARAAPFLYAGGPQGVPNQLFLPHFTADGIILEQYTFVEPTTVHGADSQRVWSISGLALTWWPR